MSNNPMRLVARYRQLAADYRRLAAKLTNPTDTQAMELFATGWDKAAAKREAMLRKQWLAGVGQMRADDVQGTSHKTDAKA